MDRRTDAQTDGRPPGENVKKKKKFLDINISYQISALDKSIAAAAAEAASVPIAAAVEC